MKFGITLQPGGTRFECDEATTLLRAGLDAGSRLPFSCRSGVCRTCRGKIVSGSADPGLVHPNYLSASDIAAGYVHLCQARPLSDCVIEIDELDPAQSFPVLGLPARVLQLERLAADVMRVQLGVPPNEPVRFNAGQYVEVLLADGVRRAYSIASAPHVDGLRQFDLHVRHMPGGLFTDRLFSTVKVRDMLRIEAPLGQFHLRDDARRPAILLASGTGFAPIKAMVEASLAAASHRPLHVYWGGRARQDLYLDALARQWAHDHAHIAYTPVLSAATPACDWQGRTGFVHEAVLEDHGDLGAFDVYACGAPAMVEAARRDFCARRNLPEDRFFADSFVSQADLAVAQTIS
ncbi:CDP-6-deoxy-delta-3,4-glucoseen reductase [Paraburkholderia sp. J12]|uniref:CDP-6-deoxy-delta-3,4-glucoseen reductase n=1 Tax=Paraburkholderia sp. J12 TaxID=2805432 RepID=UPI002ABD3C57|nr:CDP-6-deoxy-delta-3,4-glucoseen reductase [Paraburkholderia sp. J12]